MDLSKLTKEDIIYILKSTDANLSESLFKKAFETKVANIGNKVYLRGLLELSNICRKNCLYCGLRNANNNVTRYELDEKTALDCIRSAYERNYGSIAIQAGERSDTTFLNKISHIVKEAKNLSDGKLGITLSLGEQSKTTYEDWFAAGAHRYLLRIESSNPDLYRKLHPNNNLHSYDTRLKALFNLKDIGYQTGTGVMIGVPFQTEENLAEDLRFLKEFDIDMVGMGPYIPHEETPLTQMCLSSGGKISFPSTEKRLELSLKMIASLRMIMPDINIVASTAMQSLHPEGREMAINAGANVVMPNITPYLFREKYLIYQNKPNLHEDINLKGVEIGYGEWGDSKHFGRKTHCDTE